MRARIFIDFWNFQLDWNANVGKDENEKPIRIPWKNLLPNTIVKTVSSKHGAEVIYGGCHVYASVDPASDAALKRFLHAMDSFPGYSVLTKDRKANNKPIHCNKCKSQIDKCPSCKERIRRTVEKGIDSAIITQMIQMAYDKVFDVAVLGSHDADLCNAVEFINMKIGTPVYHLWWNGGGLDLRNTCWDHIIMNDLLEELLPSSVVE